mgnify:CR=1 FL=1
MQAIADRIVKLIDDVEPEGDLNAKLERLVENELRRRLIRYELVDKQLARKYGMNFDDFKRNRIVEKEGYSFQAESDFWDWEMARDGIETVQDMLNSLKGTAGDN